jgi:hypothetical protein
MAESTVSAETTALACLAMIKTGQFNASVNQSLLRRGVMPDNYAVSIIIAGLVSTAAIEAVALLMGRWTGRAPRPGLERREWRLAFWWSAVPNALLFLTVYVMIESTR